MEQVVTNLVLNARDAMPNGGRVAIEIANAKIDRTSAGVNPSVPHGDYVVLCVTDTGTGMDAKTKSHLFEPFFTTKPRGSGTGLGLATIHGIVKQSGGYVWADSQLGKGSTFRVFFPRVEGKSVGDEPEAAPQVPARGTETILLVEDEPMVRRLARTVLQDAGYRVLDAGEGDEASSFAREHRNSIHLLVTNVVMPRMSGRNSPSVWCARIVA
jgi:hypothetical protein